MQAYLCLPGGLLVAINDVLTLGVILIFTKRLISNLALLGHELMDRVQCVQLKNRRAFIELFIDLNKVLAYLAYQFLYTPFSKRNT